MCGRKWSKFKENSFGVAYQIRGELVGSNGRRCVSLKGKEGWESVISG
jgi:hypothetical protein